MRIYVAECQGEFTERIQRTHPVTGMNDATQLLQMRAERGRNRFRSSAWNRPTDSVAGDAQNDAEGCAERLIECEERVGSESGKESLRAFASKASARKQISGRQSLQSELRQQKWVSRKNPQRTQDFRGERVPVFHKREHQRFPCDSVGTESAFRVAVRSQAEALLVLTTPVIFRERSKIAQLALNNRLPTSFAHREHVDAGGLMSYGPNFDDMWRLAAVYVAKILKGAKPADLPVEQPTKFELVINLKTAKALGLTIPQSLLGRADQVIQ